MNEKVFSHRPDWGVSVGAISKDGTLYFAAAITNDGFSNNGNFNRERRDVFSRPRAREIISSRLDHMILTGESVKFGFVIEYTDTAHNFMQKFRKVFQEEVAGIIHGSMVFGEIETRYRLSADEMFYALTELAKSTTLLPIKQENV